MNWKDYEHEIHEQFMKMFPSAKICYNQSLMGRYSNTIRQIDILIEDYIAGDKFLIIVDCKYYSKRIDVKEVESFIGMLQDVNAAKGILITQKGYSKAAINRAHFDPARMELDVLNFAELNENQGLEGFPFRSKYGVNLPPPFGWIIDNQDRGPFIATLYQRGLSFEKAYAASEWMYIQIANKYGKIRNLKDVLLIQEFDTLYYFPDAIIDHHTSVTRPDASTMIRTINIPSYPTPEYTGFIEFEDIILFCVLFTPNELKEKNIKKLEYVLSRVVSFEISNFNELLSDKIIFFEEMLKQPLPNNQKSIIYSTMANTYRELDKMDLADQYFAKSIELDNNNIQALNGRLDLFLLNKKDVDILRKAVTDILMVENKDFEIYLSISKLFIERDRIDQLLIILNELVKTDRNVEIDKSIIFLMLGLTYLLLGQKQEADYCFKESKYTQYKRMIKD